MNINTNERQNDRILFILRRTLWIGSCKRADIVSAFNISTTKATEDLNLAAITFDDVIERTNTGVKAKNKIKATPHQATAKRILRVVQDNDISYSDLGFDVYKYIEISNVSPSSLPNENILSTLLKSSLNEKPVIINYVSLRPNDRGTLRPILPIKFECCDGQWRISALDLDDDGNDLYLLKKFVLTRILDVRPFFGKIRKATSRYRDSIDKKFKITFNPLLTIEQVKVIRLELGIGNDNILEINSANIFEFKRKYCDNEIKTSSMGNKSVVWPIIMDIKEIREL